MANESCRSRVATLLSVGIAALIGFGQPAYVAHAAGSDSATQRIRAAIPGSLRLQAPRGAQGATAQSCTTSFDAVPFWASYLNHPAGVYAYEESGMVSASGSRKNCRFIVASTTAEVWISDYGVEGVSTVHTVTNMKRKSGVGPVVVEVSQEVPFFTPTSDYHGEAGRTEWRFRVSFTRRDGTVVRVCASAELPPLTPPDEGIQTRPWGPCD